jgi:hypothetical protein
MPRLIQKMANMGRASLPCAALLLLLLLLGGFCRLGRVVLIKRCLCWHTVDE